LRSSGGGTPFRIQEGAKVTGFAAETKAEAFWSKKSSKSGRKFSSSGGSNSSRWISTERRRSGPLNLRPGSRRRAAEMDGGDTSWRSVELS
jgi:hypothetical protein